MKKVTAQTDHEKLVSLILSNKEYQLSETAEKTLKYMQVTAQLMREFGSRFRVVEKLKEMGIPESSAYQYTNLAPKLFSTIAQVEAREFWVDVYFSNWARAWELAIKNEDTKALAALVKERRMGIVDFCGTADTLKPEHLLPPDVEIAFRPEDFPDALQGEELDEVLAELLKAPKGRTTDFLDATAEETPFTDV